MISEGPYSCDQVNVEAQRRDEQSLFNWTARMIRLRKECPEVGWGDWKIIKTGSPNVLAIRYDWRGNSLLILHNFDDKPREVKIKPGVEHDDLLFNLLAIDESRAKEDGLHHITLEAHGYRWYRVGGSNYVLQREKI